MVVWSWLKRWGLYIPLGALCVIICLLLTRVRWKWDYPIGGVLIGFVLASIFVVFITWKQSNRNRNFALIVMISVIVIPALALIGYAYLQSCNMCGGGLRVPEPDIPATADDQIVLQTQNIEMKKAKQFITTINAFNEEFADSVVGKLECPADGDAPAFSVCSGPMDIPSMEDKGFKFIIDKTHLPVESTRNCTVSFFESDDWDCETLGPAEGAPVRTKEVTVTIK